MVTVELLRARSSTTINNLRFNALTMLASRMYECVNLRNMNIQTIYVYGALDTVVTPDDAKNVIANFLPRDALVVRMPGAAHMDFAFTQCVGNSFIPGVGGCGNIRLHRSSYLMPILEVIR